MIESCENALQIVVLTLCVAVALVKAIKYQSRKWTLLSFFYGSWVLGDIYWLVCLIFFNQTPQVSAVSDLSWYAAYIFLYMLLRRAAPPESARERRFLPWVGPLFAAGMAAFYMQWGQITGNLIYAGLMGLLLFSAIRRLMDGEQRFFCVIVLIFCLLEYGLWTSSCFFDGERLMNPYYWIDFILTMCFPLFLPATRKVAAA